MWMRSAGEPQTNLQNPMDDALSVKTTVDLTTHISCVATLDMIDFGTWVGQYCLPFSCLSVTTAQHFNKAITMHSSFPSRNRSREGR